MTIFWNCVSTNIATSDWNFQSHCKNNKQNNERKMTAKKWPLTLNPLTSKESTTINLVQGTARPAEHSKIGIVCLEQGSPRGAQLTGQVPHFWALRGLPYHFGVRRTSLSSWWSCPASHSTHGTFKNRDCMPGTGVTQRISAGGQSPSIFCLQRATLPFWSANNMPVRMVIMPGVPPVPGTFEIRDLCLEQGSIRVFLKIALCRVSPHCTFKIKNGCI